MVLDWRLRDEHDGMRPAAGESRPACRSPQRDAGRVSHVLPLRRQGYLPRARRAVWALCPKTLARRSSYCNGSPGHGLPWTQSCGWSGPVAMAGNWNPHDHRGRLYGLGCSWYSRPACGDSSSGTTLSGAALAYRLSAPQGFRMPRDSRDGEQTPLRRSPKKHDAYDIKQICITSAESRRPVVPYESWSARLASYHGAGGGHACCRFAVVRPLSGRHSVCDGRARAVGAMREPANDSGYLSEPAYYLFEPRGSTSRTICGVTKMAYLWNRSTPPH